MKSTSEDIKEMLQYYLGTSGSNSAGIDMYDIFIGREPAEPTNTISVFETAGYPPQLNMDKEEKYEYPSFQIRVRSTSYTEGWSQVSAIKDVLHGRANEQWGDVYYIVIYCQSGPALLDYDKNQRVRFIINFNCQRK